MEDSKKSYSKINNELREHIIHQILEEKKSIIDVAQEHNILQSTCKSIINTYMKEGRVGKKESRVRKMKKIIQTYEIVLNPINPQMSTFYLHSKTENCIEKSIKSQKEENVNIEKQPNLVRNDFDMLQYWCQQLQHQIAYMTQQQQIMNNHYHYIR